MNAKILRRRSGGESLNNEWQWQSSECKTEDNISVIFSRCRLARQRFLFAPNEICARRYALLRCGTPNHCAHRAIELLSAIFKASMMKSFIAQ